VRRVLRDLEKVVERAAEKLPGADGRVAKTEIKLQEPVLLERSFKSRFSFGHGKVSIELVGGEDGKIVGFNFSNAHLDGLGIECRCGRRGSSSERVWNASWIPLAALPTEVLEKILESAWHSLVQ